MVRLLSRQPTVRLPHSLPNWPPFLLVSEVVFGHGSGHIHWKVVADTSLQTDSALLVTPNVTFIAFTNSLFLSLYAFMPIFMYYINIFNT